MFLLFLGIQCSLRFVNIIYFRINFSLIFRVSPFQSQTTHETFHKFVWNLYGDFCSKTFRKRSTVQDGGNRVNEEFYFSFSFFFVMICLYNDTVSKIRARVGRCTYRERQSIFNLSSIFKHDKVLPACQLLFNVLILFFYG